MNNEETSEGEPEGTQQLVQLLSKAFEKSAGVSSNTLKTKRALLNVKQPRAFSVSHNLLATWLSQFNQYATLVKIPNTERRAHLLNPLDQTSYLDVELLQLPCELSYGEFCGKLPCRFDSGKTTQDYKLLL